ncbi:hypothetical protein [Sphingobium sp. Sx8-8]|nr:hypothetical protein [Sphingobium sp. Sx8-8]
MSNNARPWNPGHETPSPFPTLMQAFQALHRIRWSAPWQQEQS